MAINVLLLTLISLSIYTCIVADTLSQIGAVPRVMYIQGLSSEHNDHTTNWAWKSDNVPANIKDALDYCRLYNPSTVSVRSFAWEQTPVQTHSRMSQECLQPNVMRIMYSPGLVNQHIDVSTGWKWQTDSDGVSGSSLNKLDYCKKFYPMTISVLEFGIESSSTWREPGNLGGTFTRSLTSFECVQIKVPRISYWPGKVNQHINIDNGWTWETDPDGTSGSLVNKLDYCKKWYPKTVSVRLFGVEFILGWKDAGNKPIQHKSVETPSYECVQ